MHAATEWASIAVLAKLSAVGIVGQFTLALAVSAPVVGLANLGLRQAEATDVREEYRFGDYFGLRLLCGFLALLVIGGAVPTLGYGNWYWHGYPPTAWVAARYLLGGYSTMTEAAIMANPECFYDQVLMFYYAFGPFLGVNYQNYVDNISNNDIPWAPYFE